MNRVVILGLTGGIGSGKSTVARFFAELGAIILDADQIAHEVLARMETVESVVRTFGPEIIRDGKVDRGRLGRLVFDSPDRLRQLNALIHPAVRDEIREKIAEVRRSATTPTVIVLDVPLLLESELNSLCDKRLFVDAPAEERRERVEFVRGWEPGELDRREKNQKPLAEKEAAADYKVTNSGAVDPVRAAIGVIYGELIQ